MFNPDRMLIQPFLRIGPYLVINKSAHVAIKLFSKRLVCLCMKLSVFSPVNFTISYWICDNSDKRYDN